MIKKHLKKTNIKNLKFLMKVFKYRTNMHMFNGQWCMFVKYLKIYIFLQLFFCTFLLFGSTVSLSLISSDLPYVEWHNQFITIHLKPLVWQRISYTGLPTKDETVKRISNSKNMRLKIIGSAFKKSRFMSFFMIWKI